MTALDGNLVDISLSNADPLPRLSVHVGTTCILVRPVAGVSPKKSIKLMSTARAVERRDYEGPLPFSNIHGHSSHVSSWLNHGESQGSNSPRDLRTGAHLLVLCLARLRIDSRSRVLGVQLDRGRTVTGNFQLTCKVIVEKLDARRYESYRVSTM